MEKIRGAHIPPFHLGIWFLGQNSFIFKDSQSFTVAIDPYLSDYCATRGIVPGPTEKSRKFPPPVLPEELAVDLILLTHSHCDHADPETLKGVAQSFSHAVEASPKQGESPAKNLAAPIPQSKEKKPLHQGGWLRIAGPRLALEVARKAGIPLEQLRLIQVGEEVFFSKKPGILAAAERLRSGNADKGVLVRGTFAIPTDTTDLNHMGFLIRFAGGITLWNTGDTAWSEHLLELGGKDVRETVQRWQEEDTAASPQEAMQEGKGEQHAALSSAEASHRGPDLMLVCINAGYGNLSHWEAACLAGAAEPRLVIPTHYDLFPHNSLDPRPFKTSLEKRAPHSLCEILEVGRGYLYSKERGLEGLED
ncbi:MAG TPA: MBL fold metallo-hydrolase [Termitinemataceae bacterium]|nr:MBL fold metallo-hydrolase [Termitinemataceae bacterium]HOM24435.1 MBL fold metallo-hydrolase [Termitinemataceae bacterium]HPQ01546.1 MBL fold metallo-hydrolase [Termitinemataceae bacterium]